MVSSWRKKGNAFDYVQDDSVDPRPLVSPGFYLSGEMMPCRMQLVGIAKGLHYLHGHESGAICHGDLRGVGFLSLHCYYASL